MEAVLTPENIPEAEVTPAMIEAGAAIIYWSGNVDYCRQGWVLRQLAKDMFAAMMAARPVAMHQPNNPK
jgi:hypothetical protein